MSPAVVPAVFALSAAILSADAPQSNNADSIVVEIERRTESGGWQQIDPQLVLQREDQIRFRFQTSFPAYVYVWDHSSGGKTELLYPRPSRSSAAFQPGVWYLLPDGDGLFTVGGPPGFDVTYWVASPQPLSGAPAAPRLPAFPDSIRPKCNADVLRARGLCTDESAGVRPARMNDPFWESLGSATPGLRSRELTFTHQTAPTRISTPPGAGYILYEFRIAHR
jgi:hypothetical protein